MAVGESVFPSMPVIDGVRIGVASAGIKKPGRRDLVVFELAEGASVAATFTRNAFCAAPVSVAKRHLGAAGVRYWLINTGNANAGTGEAGIEAAEACCRALAARRGASAESVLPFSTGVIGEPLPVARIEAALDAAVEDLDAAHWAAAAEGILTTDTRPKGATRSIEVGGRRVTLNGIGKGSGMICPNMATMLAFVATDAQIEPALLTRLLADATERSFNRITVDSDTSTNDACALVATGTGAAIADAAAIAVFATALTALMQELAQSIVRDGEGATKFITIDVREAQSQREALDVAYSVAHSPLVKTALYASDANWGRLLMAVGKTPIEAFDVTRVAIELNDVSIVEAGARAPSYSEEAGSAALAAEEIEIVIRLGRGDQRERVWTSDLSHEYVTINADYRS